MAGLVYPELPNAITQVIAGADTNWHLITVPNAVPLPQRANVVAAFVALGASGAAGTVLLDFNHAEANPPTVGFPLLSGGTLVFAAKNNYWYKFSSATDSLYIVWQY